jgi:hypothetical protein
VIVLVEGVDFLRSGVGFGSCCLFDLLRVVAFYFMGS